jgi:biopolymer transport protein ExbD
VKLRSLRIERQPKLMIIPMIDIIFFLLVFFMMSTLYMVEQRTMPVNLPQVSAAQSDLEKSVFITIAKDGAIYVDQEQIPARLFKKRIQARIARQNETAFILRADKEAEYGQVIMILDELKGLGIKKVAVATEQAQR